MEQEYFKPTKDDLKIQQYGSCTVFQRNVVEKDEIMVRAFSP